MKPFDLEAAKAGAKVVCSNGMPARIICFDAHSHGLSSVLVVLIADAGGDEVATYMNSGGRCLSRHESYDLRMAPVKREGWVNVYPLRKAVQGPNADTSADGGIAEAGLGVWPTQALADKFANKRRIACVHVEWDE